MQSDVTDFGMKCIGDSMKELRCFVLLSCLRVTDIGITSVLDGCKKLEYISTNSWRSSVLSNVSYGNVDSDKLSFATSGDDVPLEWRNIFACNWND